MRILDTLSAAMGVGLIIICVLSCSEDKPTGHTLGKDWTLRETGTVYDLYDVCWNGSRFVAVGMGPTVLISETGSEWEPVSDPFYPSFDPRAIAWSEPLQLYVVVGPYNSVSSSSNGQEWTTRQLENPGYNTYFEQVAWFDTHFVAFGNGRLAVSKDGGTWTWHDGPARVRGVGTNDSLIMCVAGDKVYSSNNGVTWTERFDADTLLYGITWFDASNIWVCTGHLGHVRFSTDGDEWIRSAANAGESSSVFDVVAMGSTCVAVGSANGPGLILTTSDGIQWDKIIDQSVGWLNALTISGGMFVIVGDRGVILTSP